MKKLMFALAGAVGIAASGYATDKTWAERAYFTEGFEGSAPTSNFNFVDPDEVAQNDSAAVAYGSDTISAPTITGQPAFASAGSYGLELSTESGVLERRVNGKDTGTSIANPGKVYIDTLVQFTPCLENDTANYDAAADAKIAVWLQEFDAGKATASTNLMIRAGYLYYDDGEEICSALARTYTNTVAGVDFSVAGWHRLTITEHKDVFKDAYHVTAYSVKIDGVDVVSTECAFDDATLNSGDNVATAYATDLNANKLFPAISATCQVVAENDSYSSALTAVGFSGTGYIDNLEVSAENPLATGAIDFELAWDAGANAIGYTVAGKAYTVADPSTAGSDTIKDVLAADVVIGTPTVPATTDTDKYAATVDTSVANKATVTVTHEVALTIALPAEGIASATYQIGSAAAQNVTADAFWVGAGSTVTIAAEYATGYMAAAWNPAGNAGVYTISEAGTITLAAQEIAATAGDDNYASVSAAIAAVATAGGTVKLYKDCGETITVPAGVTLDLNGKAFTGTLTENNGTIVVYDAATAEELLQSPGTIKAGTEITQAGKWTFPADTLVNIVVDAFGSNLRPTITVTVPDDKTLTWLEGVGPYKQMFVDGDVVFGGDLSYGWSDDLTTMLTVTGAVTLASNVSITNYAEMAVSGKITAGEYTISLSAANAKLTNTDYGDGNALADGKVVSAVDDYKVALADDVYTLAAMAYVAQVGDTKYESLAAALAAANAAETAQTITLLADATATGTLAIDKAMTINLTAAKLTIDADATVTVNAALTFVYGGGLSETKGFKNDGKIVVNENLDLSSLQWANGLLNSTSSKAKFVIANGKYVKFQAFTTGEIQNNPNKMEAALEGFLSGSANGAQFINGSAMYTFDGTAWYLGTVTAPTAATGLTYDGTEQTGVAEGANYTLTGTAKAMDAGNYTATATLAAEYKWDDGTTAAKAINWSIAQADTTISVVPTASAEIEKGAALSTISLTGGSASVAGTFAWTDGTVTVSESGNFGVTFTPTDSANYKTATCTVAVTVKSSGKTVTPGSTTVEVKAESAEAATNGVTIAVSSPDTSKVSDADYAEYFTLKATETSAGSNTYTVEAVLKDEIVKAEEPTEDLAASLSAVAAGTAESAAVSDAKPGLWYSVKYTDAVGSIGTANEGARAQADKDGNVTITMPKTSNSATAQFYQIQVNTADKTK